MGNKRIFDMGEGFASTLDFRFGGLEKFENTMVEFGKGVESAARKLARNFSTLHEVLEKEEPRDPVLTPVNIETVRMELDPFRFEVDPFRVAVAWAKDHLRLRAHLSAGGRRSDYKAIPSGYWPEMFSQEGLEKMRTRHRDPDLGKFL